ncbi:MAG: 4-deoxy-4-formamido-L-arabinose-phosphoundecaprenol deformylase [Deltaproteobacteria bacterium]|nr:4-deoxy-4-formamido-L-arabinose-phosphoundecaprenol deformylase [Deltaproteobacteria bacterium]
MDIGLRIDVDTLRGTRYGVPALGDLLAKYGISASFFFSVGPDNMGRHLWRLLRPRFLWKMMRTRGPSLYGWDILLRGTAWPGPVIGQKLPHVIGQIARAGHETGLHCWDHYAWQSKIDVMTAQEISQSLNQGVAVLARILGQAPTCSAVPAWKCRDQVLLEKAHFPFTYNSDCRGRSIFYPAVAGKPLSQPQIPVTLPTYDEAVGHGGVTTHNYNDYLLSQITDAGLNVLTIHAEVEGIACLDMFDRFLLSLRSMGGHMVPLGQLLKRTTHIETAVIKPREMPGREGWLACQTEWHGNNC